MPDRGLNARAREILGRLRIDPESVLSLPAEDELLDNKLAAVRRGLARLGKAFGEAELEHPQAKEWAEAFLADPESAGNLLVFGPIGVGKTHLVVSVIRHVALKIAERPGRALRWKNIGHPDLNAELRPSSDERHITTLRACQEAELLSVDDIGASMTTEWNTEGLYRIANTRWHERRPTIVTTNLDPKVFRSLVGDRIASRLIENATTIALKGGDRRRGWKP